MATTGYDIGDVVRLRCTFRDDADALVSPGTVTLQLRKGTDGAIESHTVVAASVGVFVYDWSATEAGTWHYRWSGSGGATAADEGAFVVRASKF